MNLLDAIITIILAVGAWRGYRRGLIITVGGFLGFLGGIWLAGRYYLALSQYLGEKLGLKEVFARVLIPFCADVPTSTPGSGLPLSPSDPGFTGYPQSFWEPWLGLKAGIGGATLAHLLAGALVKLIAFFLLWGIVSYLIWWLAIVLTRVARLFFLGGVNRLGGLGLGLITRALGLVVFIGMLSPVILSLAASLSPDLQWGQVLTKIWNTSLLVPYFMKSWNVAVPVLKYVFGIF